MDYGTSRSSPERPPLAIGGTGGSGTRLIVQIIQELGYHIGHDFNEAKDNLLFTLLFRRKSILLEEPATTDRSFGLLVKCLRGDQALSAAEIAFIRALAKGDRHNFPETWLARRASKVLEQPHGPRRSLIAWKEPNTHVFLERLLQHESRPRYLHVVRDGLDMAFSENQNQLLLWGDCYLNRPVTKSPADALAYWNAVHRRILGIRARYPDRILIVPFDRICQRHAADLQRLFRFIGISPGTQQRERIDELIQPPETLGRAGDQDLGQFDRKALKQYHQIMQALHEAVEAPT